MARKKQSEKDMSVIDLAEKQGLTLMTDQSQVDVRDWLPTGIPHLDRNAPNAFSRIMEIYGKNSSGKSTYGVHLIKQAQMFDIPVVLIDVEGTSSQENMEQLGADPAKIFHIQPENGEIMTVEKVTESMRKVVKTFKDVDLPVLVIWDSLAQTPAEAQIQEGYNPNRIGTKSQAIGHMITVLAQEIGQTNILFVIINQARDDMSNPMFPTIKSTGGHALKHAASVRLEVSKIKAREVTGDVYDPITGKTSKESVGHVFKLKTEKSKVTAPGKVTETYLISEPFKGIDFVENLYRSSVDQYGLIKKAAGWRKFKPEEGDEISMYERDWIEFLGTEEGNTIAKELFIKQMERNFPNWFAPLDNENFDIRTNPFYAELEKFYKDGLYPTERKAGKKPKEEKKEENKDKGD